MKACVTSATVLLLSAALLSCGRKLPPPVFVPPPEPKLEIAGWHMFRHDAQRTGRSKFAGPSAPQVLKSRAADSAVYDSRGAAYLCGEAGLRVFLDDQPLWGIESGDDCYVSAPTIARDGMVFVPIELEDYQVHLYSPEGELQWANTYPYYLEPIVADEEGTIYIPTAYEEDDYEYSITAVGIDGETRWKTLLGGAEIFDTLALSPDGGIVFTAYLQIEEKGWRSVVIKVAAGREVLWTTELPYAVEPGHWVFPSIPAISDDGTSYVEVSGVGLYAVSADGEVLWEFLSPEDLGASDIDPPAIGPNGNIYYTAYGKMDDERTALVAVSPEGEMKWMVEGQFEGAPIADAEGTVYIGQGYGEPGYIAFSARRAAQTEHLNSILAVNPDGTEKWSFSAPDEIDVGKVLCMDNDGNLVVRGRLPGADYYDESLFWLGDG